MLIFKQIFLFTIISIISIISLNFRAEVVALEQMDDVILLETSDVAPNRPFWLLYTFRAEEGEVIPWVVNSGDEKWLSWELPDGFKIGQTILPTPQKIMSEKGPQFIFGDEFTILQEIIPDKKMISKTSSDFYDLKMYGTWSACRESCIEKNVVKSFNFKIGQGKPNPEVASYFRVARDKYPIPSPWPIRATVTSTTFELLIDLDEIKQKAIQKIEFKPAGPGFFRGEVVDVDAKDGQRLFAPRKWNSDYFATVEGILTLYLSDNQGKEHFWVSARNTIPELLVFEGDERTGEIELNIWLGMAFAFLGGMILNLMPCVLPVLTIKIFGLMKAGAISPSRMRFDGLAYTLGILVSFTILTIVLITFRSFGEQVGWGFQLQSPYFTLALIYLILAVGLNFSGLFEMPSRFTGFGQKLTEKEGVKGPFFTGILATLVATPCTAPFMAPAIGYALTLEALETLMVFLSLGLGLAFPYLLISFIPKIHGLFPKPGPWMVTFKKILAVPMYLTLLWLLWVFAQQIDFIGVLFALASLIFIVIWVMFFKAKTMISYGVVFGLALVLAYTSLSQPVQISTRQEGGYRDNFEVVEFSRTNVESLRAEGRPIFLNFTAAWCITCLVQEKLVFNIPRVQNHFEENDIVFMVADWTNPNPEISSMLEEFGRSGIPLYLYFPRGVWSDPKILPEILTPQKLIELISPAE